MSNRIVMILGILPLIVPVAQAQSCFARRGGVAAQVYAAPQVAAQAYVQPAYVQQKVVAQQVAVAPFIVTVPVASQAVPAETYGLDHYYTVQRSYQDKAALREVVREELRNFLTQNTPTLPVPPGAQAPAAAPVPNQPPPPPAPAPPASAEMPAALDSRVLGQVLTTFTNRCAKCHGATKDDALQGGFRLVSPQADGTYQLADVSEDKRWKVYAMATAGVMPPIAAKDASKAIPNGELPALLRWALQK